MEPLAPLASAALDLASVLGLVGGVLAAGVGAGWVLSTRARWKRAGQQLDQISDRLEQRYGTLTPLGLFESFDKLAPELRDDLPGRKEAAQVLEAPLELVRLSHGRGLHGSLLREPPFAELGLRQHTARLRLARVSPFWPALASLAGLLASLASPAASPPGLELPLLVGLLGSLVVSLLVNFQLEPAFAQLSNKLEIFNQRWLVPLAIPPHLLLNESFRAELRSCFGEVTQGLHREVRSLLKGTQQRLELSEIIASQVESELGQTRAALELSREILIQVHQPLLADSPSSAAKSSNRGENRALSIYAEALQHCETTLAVITRAVETLEQALALLARPADEVRTTAPEITLADDSIKPNPAATGPKNRKPAKTRANLLRSLIGVGAGD